ncbi:MAG: outer membrane protein OmpA-like peptidoglycan-associated protein [Granulosicoccus sp.]|jgi:outer membrane protein OmpA-like peptidoglycan-associated protein
MNVKRLTLTYVVLITTMITGCATGDPNRRAKTGAAIGAVVGAVAGNQSNSRNGKYVGALVGALTGAAIGNYMDDQQRQLENKLALERQNNEVSITRIDAQTLRLDVRSEASFDINSAVLRKDFRDSLETMADIIGEFDQTAIHVIGHTDSTGTQSYNQQLSEKRATSVSRFLNRNGVERERLRYSGRGENQPIDSNSTSSGRSKNRRVEIYLKTIVKNRESEAFRAPT